MLQTGPAKKLTIFLEEADKAHGRPVYEIVLEILYRHKAAGATIFRGMAGFGGEHVLHMAKILDLSASLPVKIEAVDSEEKINTILLEITPLVHKGLIEVSDTKVIKGS